MTCASARLLTAPFIPLIGRDNRINGMIRMGNRGYLIGGGVCIRNSVDEVTAARICERTYVLEKLVLAWTYRQFLVGPA
jgi:hypothetical protein